MWNRAKDFVETALNSWKFRVRGHPSRSNHSRLFQLAQGLPTPLPSVPRARRPSDASAVRVCQMIRGLLVTLSLVSEVSGVCYPTSGGNSASCAGTTGTGYLSFQCQVLGYPGTSYCCCAQGSTINAGAYCTLPSDCGSTTPVPVPTPAPTPTPAPGPAPSSGVCASMGITDTCCKDAPSGVEYVCGITDSCGRGVCVPTTSSLCGCSGTQYCGITTSCCGDTCCDMFSKCTGSAGSCSCTSNTLAPAADSQCGATLRAACPSPPPPRAVLVVAIAQIRASAPRAP